MMSKLKCAESSSDNLCITGSKSFSVKKKKKVFHSCQKNNLTVFSYSDTAASNQKA